MDTEPKLTSGDLEAALKAINKDLYIKDESQLLIYYNENQIARIDKVLHSYHFSHKINFLDLPMDQLTLIHNTVIDYVCQFTGGRDYQFSITPDGIVGPAIIAKPL